MNMITITVIRYFVQILAKPDETYVGGQYCCVNGHLLVTFRGYSY